MPAQGSNECQQQSDHGGKSSNALVQLQDFSLELNRVHLQHVAGDHRSVVSAQPTHYGGTRYAERRDDVHVSSDADQFSEAVVVRTLWSLL